ncbi:retrovirus-related pol polyprotein from transposon TNT 1-94 [Tanacetum coccineum]
MASSHNQAITDVGSENRPPMLEKGSYKEADLTGNDKKRFEADIDAMNAILLGIPNDIYNFVYACKTAQVMWQRVERLMQGTDLSKQELTSRLLDEFDKFKGMPGESIESYYSRFSKIMNNLERHGFLLKAIANNTKFLNSLQSEWDKYVTMKNVNASRAKRAARTHDPLALVANHYAAPSSSHTSSPYYVTYPPFVADFDVETQSFKFQGDASNDDPMNNLTTMMLLAKAITQHYSTPTNNCLHASSNTHNQVYVQDGCVNVQSKNVGNAGNAGRNTGRVVGNSRNATYGQQANGNNATVQRVPRASTNSQNTQNVQCYNCNEKGHYARVCPKPKVRDSNYFKEQMLLAKKDKLNATCIMMARLQSDKNDYDDGPSYDSDFANESSSPPSKMPKQSQMKRYFATLEYDVKSFECVFKDKLAVNGLNFASDGFQKKFTNEVKEIYESYESMENELAERSRENANSNDKFDRFLEASLAHDVKNFVMLSFVEIENENLIKEIERISKESKDVQESLFKGITYAYGDVRAKNQDLLITISELKEQLKTFEKGKSVNTKFDKPSFLDKRICVTPFNKQSVQKTKFISKIDEKNVLTKPVTSQTLPKKKKEILSNTKVIASGMYKIKTKDKQETHEKTNVIVSTSTGGVEDVISVKRPNSASSRRKVSCLTLRVDVHLNKTNVTNVNSKNASNAKSNVIAKRALFTSPIAVKIKFLDGASIAAKTRFVDVTPLAAKDKISSSTPQTPKSKKATTPIRYMKNKA